MQQQINFKFACLKVFELFFATSFCMACLKPGRVASEGDPDVPLSFYSFLFVDLRLSP